MILLRSYSPFPSGEFLYVQQYPGGSQTFKGDGLSIEQQAKRVLDFRKGNGLPGATLSQVLTDISAFTCNRLGSPPNLCFDTDAPVKVHSMSGGGGCSTCGRRV